MAKIDPWSNLVAWALTMGYDEDKDWTLPISEPDEPPAAPTPDRLIFEENWPEGQYSANFHANEFRCRGTRLLPPNGMDKRLIEVLQRIRNHYGAPVTINSGFRSPQHNAAVGGAPGSQHLLGTAADFVVRGVSPAQVFRDLDPLWPGGLGRYNNFTHIDTRPNRVRW